MGCGLWSVAQSPRKEGFLEMSTLAMIHSAVRLSPGPCKGLIGYLFIFCSECLSSLLWDALPALSPQTLLAWPLDPGFWSPALSPVSQRRSYREPSPPPLTSQAPEGPPAPGYFYLRSFLKEQARESQPRLVPVENLPSWGKNLGDFLGPGLEPSIFVFLTDLWEL